jgi:hypothetical protein
MHIHPVTSASAASAITFTSIRFSACCRATTTTSHILFHKRLINKTELVGRERIELRARRFCATSVAACRLKAVVILLYRSRLGCLQTVDPKQHLNFISKPNEMTKPENKFIKRNIKNTQPLLSMQLPLHLFFQLPPQEYF